MALSLHLFCILTKSCALFIPGPYFKILWDCLLSFCHCMKRALLSQDPLYKISGLVDTSWGWALPVSHSGCHRAAASVDENCCWWAEHHPHRAFLLRSHCQHPFLDTLEGIDTPQRSPRFAGGRLLGESSLSPTGPWAKEPHCGPFQTPRPAVWLIKAGCAAVPSGLFCTASW